MNEIEVFRKEIPPITVQELARELEALGPLVECWMRFHGTPAGEDAFGKIVGRLRPDLMKALVMIARKETESIRRTRKSVELTQLGRVLLAGAGRQWVDVLLTGDRTPLLRRVALGAGGVRFHAVTWSGCAALQCAGIDCWNEERRIWLWDSADGDESVERLRDRVLPRLPLHLQAGQTFTVPDWHRHLSFVSAPTLLRALDAVETAALGERTEAAILALLEEAGADLNPLWSHYLDGGEWEQP